jgi:hypothetical protein
MTCHEVQVNLSLYLYGELDFAREEALEQHLEECALCQRFLAREKTWHTSLNSSRLDAPLELLSQCRQNLASVIAHKAEEQKQYPVSWRHWTQPFGFAAGRWSVGLALASFLVFIGFTSARWIDRHGLPGGSDNAATSGMSLVNPSYARIRDIQPGDHNQVRILFDQVNQRAVTGTPEDETVRRLLLAAMQDTADPGIRVDSVEVLKGQNGADVRDALLKTVRHDPNAAVRLKALESLRPFASDAPTRDALKFVLQHDDNPDVRSEAIDVLAPASPGLDVTPDLAITLQEIMRSEQENDYVRARCLQILRSMNAPLDIY